MRGSEPSVKNRDMWIPSSLANPEASKKLWQEVTFPQNKNHIFSGHPFFQYEPVYTPMSIPTDANGAPDNRTTRAGDLYPLAHTPLALASFENDRAAGQPLYFDGDLRPEARGFLLCAENVDEKAKTKAKSEVPWAGWFVAQTPVEGGGTSPFTSTIGHFFEDSSFYYLPAID